MGRLKLLLGASLALGCCHQNNSNLSALNKDSKLENIALSDYKNNLSSRNQIIYECFNKACEIKYEKEIEGDYWQTPEETEKIKKGDCEDMALYLSYLLDKEQISHKLTVGYFGGDNRSVNKNDLHCWVYVKMDNEWNILDPTVKTIIPNNSTGIRYESLGDSHRIIKKLVNFKKGYEGSLASIPQD